MTDLEDHHQSKLFASMEAATYQAFANLALPFESLNRAHSHDSETLKSFIQGFFVFANSYSEVSCIEFAKIIRLATVDPEIRKQPTDVIANGLRRDVFSRLDYMLKSYCEAVSTLLVDVKEQIASAVNKSVTGAALTGAASGRLIGGLGERGDFWAKWGAIASVAAQQESVKRHQKNAETLLNSLTPLAISHLDSYLDEVPGTFCRLFDHGASRCLVSNVDFLQLEQHQQRIQSDLSAKISVFKSQIRQFIEKVEAESIEREKKKNLDSLKGCLSLLVLLVVVAIGIAWPPSLLLFAIAGITAFVVVACRGRKKAGSKSEGIKPMATNPPALPKSPTLPIIVHRDGLDYGPFSIEDTKAYLRAGNLVPDDFARFQDQSEWSTIKQLLRSPVDIANSSRPLPPIPTDIGKSD